ncbi:MAG: glycogen debranching enzyme N-terminal domain-containing protein [Planctomycetes bacterium]|nr:glycogen debranching enzyme N-terminal domain-containing protein [Planctomycetota bacterium]
MPALVHIDREECLQLDRATTREWIETDGRGGYASSTILMCPTRRHHGWLVTPFGPERKRFVWLARFEEAISGGGKSFPLSMGRYPGLWSPHGHQAIESVELVPYPRFAYRFGATWVRREILMVKGEPTVLVRWTVEDADVPLELDLRPLYAYREADALTHENMALDPRVERLERGIRSRPYVGLPTLSITFSANAQRFEADPVWYRRIEYTKELERGYDGQEDNFSPGWFKVAIAPNAPVVVAATLGEPIADPAALWAREEATRRARMARFDGSLKRALELAAEDFLYRRRDGGRLGVLTGFPWYFERGREALIALPGLLLSRGEVEKCGNALEATLPFLKDGLLPTHFGENRDDSRYEGVDTGLWFARAVRLYEQSGGSAERVRDVFVPALERIADGLGTGRTLPVTIDEKGLVSAGTPDIAVTWMNAVALGKPVTPRDGCAVEVNALWWFLLAYLEDLHERAGDHARARNWTKRKRLATRGFLQRFWLEDERSLADTWKDGVADRADTANAVIASSLEFSPLARGKRTDVFRRARAELLTPRGLRTLAPTDERYVGVHRGSHDEREMARHCGSVWPWLSSFYIETYLRAYVPRLWRMEPLSELVLGFSDLLQGYGLNQISELYEGDPPHRPRGAIASALNTAELLRALHLLEEPPQ